MFSEVTVASRPFPDSDCSMYRAVNLFGIIFPILIKVKHYTRAFNKPHINEQLDLQIMQIIHGTTPATNAPAKTGILQWRRGFRIPAKRSAQVRNDNIKRHAVHRAGIC